MQLKRATIYLSDQDRRARAAIQQCYGISTFSDAIRRASRLLGSIPRPFTVNGNELTSSLQEKPPGPLVCSAAWQALAERVRQAQQSAQKVQEISHMLHAERRRNRES